MGEDFANTVVVALDCIEAAPKPSPTAGTEPTCLDGPALETGVVCTTDNSRAPVEDTEMMDVEL